MKYKLTRKCLMWRWHFIPDGDDKFAYHFVDEDEATKDWSGEKSSREKRIELGLPRYQISFERVPENKKRKQYIWLQFNDAGVCTSYKWDSFNEKDAMRHIEYALLWLRANGYLECVEEGEK